MKQYLTIALTILLLSEALPQIKLLEQPPLHYIAYRTHAPLEMDGILNEADWQNAPWTEDFTDIEGPGMPKPLHRTRVKMLWDDDYFYIAAELEEPHIWATFTERESIIFHENNFEVFIDPSGDTHNYYELEINALGTIWDLLLTKPYRNGGLPFSAWDIRGFKFGIHKQGTINDPSDIDTMWTVEMAFPWKILAEAAPGKQKPSDGDQWRVNFSRVQWKLDIVDGAYQKTIDPETGQPYPEFNWVWSPQWAINMHKPEYWGYVQFSDIPAGTGTEAFRPHPDTHIRYLLRELYVLQMRYRHEHGHFAKNLEELQPENPAIFKEIQPAFDVAQTRFMISAPSYNGHSYWHITEDSRIWKWPPGQDL